MKVLNTIFVWIFLIAYAFTSILFLSDFSKYKQTVGPSLSYYIIVALLIGVVLSARQLIKPNKR